ncbi:MAG: nitroreductase family protein [Chloroflexi bacterium HGW-Chloroflexi-10]|nr:MAG: nitroreductase family protein [Chloroflexi bacterium HGW-Chloroflexi-10]
MKPFPHIPLNSYQGYPPEEMLERAVAFRQELQRRRTIRQFSSQPVPQEVIENCLLAAGTAPNGANLQPWRFVVVRDPQIKAQIREGAEKEEREFYQNRAPQEWLQALEPFGTDENKPYLETAPCLIIIFGMKSSSDSEGNTVKNYYVNESVGIATGFLIAALHHAGLATLTHTPSPMGFLNSILGRPENEKPFLVLVAGYPAEDAVVPIITKKPLEEIAVFL